MKTIINKILKILPKVYGNSIFKSVETKDGFMIKCCHDLYNISNPMEAEVNFEIGGKECDEAILTWKDTGKLLTKDEAQKYWDAQIFTDIAADQLEYEDFLFVSNKIKYGRKFISVNGTGYMGGFLTDYDCDFSKADEFEKLISDTLPKKEVFIDTDICNSFIRIQ